MSRLAGPGTDDHPDAAEKHLDDALALFVAERWDGAAYLSGYVVECCMKSLLRLEGRHVAEHRFESLLHEIALANATAGARSAPYVSSASIRGLRSSRIWAWRAALRYQPAGVVSEQQAQDWIGDAEEVYRDTVARMRLDGVA